MAKVTPPFRNQNNRLRSDVSLLGAVPDCPEVTCFCPFSMVVSESHSVLTTSQGLKLCEWVSLDFKVCCGELTKTEPAS